MSAAPVVNYEALSRSWARDAEAWRKDGLLEVAKYAMSRHIETREKARQKATEAKVTP